MSASLVDFAPPPEPPHERTWTASSHDYGAVTDRITAVPLARPRVRWVLLLGLAFSLVLVLAVAVWWLLYRGVGVWGVDVPVAWGFAIINFVWWIGIGHAGTLISAILLLLRQGWRTTINRFAEAMTLFAVLIAGLFPLLHLGRPSVFYYLVPYPSTLGVWPQWRSPLVWDLFAVLTYATVSLLFWYLGLLPDLATLRDTARGKWQARIAGVFALGWRGSARHWQRHQKLYLLLAGLATPLVVSVHSIVSLDFATGIVPGWHSTIFPPYFVAGAIFSGFAMVLTLVIPVRAAYGLRDLISERHLDAMARVMLVAGLVVDAGYCFEFFTAWYAGEAFERHHLAGLFTGSYRYATAVMLACNVAVPQLLWFRAFRRRPLPLLLVSLLINVGMWTERYVIVVTPLHQDFVPSAWGLYQATVWDWLLFVGTLGLFVFLMLLFMKLVPMLSMSELRDQHHEEWGARASRGEGAAPGAPRAAAGDLADQRLFGISGTFTQPGPLLTAARQLREAGYRKVEAYTPFAVRGLADALGHRTRIAGVVLAGAALGGAGAWWMMFYTSVLDYPWNVGGRPVYSLPSYVPIMFELTVLGGAVVGTVAFLVRCGFPHPYHPIMNAVGFERVARDRFLLCVERDDASFDRARVRELLAKLGAADVQEVPR